MNILRPRCGTLMRSLSVILLSVVGFPDLCSAQVADQVVADMPFAYWTMNDTGPGDATNAGLDTTESATYSPSQLEFEVAGIADPNSKAVRFLGFDEDTNLAGYMNIADSAKINDGGPWLAKTIELWFSVDDANSSTEQVLYEQGGSTRGLAMYVRGGKVYVGAHNSADDDGNVASPWPAGLLGDGDELAFVTTDIESNTAYQLAIVYEGDVDGFDGTITGYLNGEEFGQVDGIGTFFSHTDDVRVGGVAAQTHFDLDYSGATPYGNDNGLDGDAPTPQAPYYFSGIIDDVALYDKVLSAERIKAHFDALEYVVGDFDGNGSVELADFTTLAGNFNKPGRYSDGDINFDGMVSMADFAVWRTAFSPAPAAAAVPEPSPSWMIGCGCFGLSLLRRNRNK